MKTFLSSTFLWRAPVFLPFPRISLATNKAQQLLAEGPSKATATWTLDESL